MTFRLDADFDSKTFYESIRPDFTQWSHLVPLLLRPYGIEVLKSRAFGDGVNLVACINETHVLKIFPPFHRHQWESEPRTLQRLQGCLTLPIPTFFGAGEIENGWTYVLMSKLEGESLEEIWKKLSHRNQLQIMHEVGKVMAEVHALPVAELANMKPEWKGFLELQKHNCKARLLRLKSPAWMVAEVESWLSEAFSCIPKNQNSVILTGEYTPFNLLVTRVRGSEEYELSGMIDFADSMVGFRDYDFMGPGLFLCAGDGTLLQAMLDGYRFSMPDDRESLKKRWMALQFLHRYCDFDAQVRIEGWQDRVKSIDELTDLLWPI